MKGDFSEFTFARRRHSSSVRMDQGRVRLDADWNERLDVRVHEDTVCLDVWEREVRSTEDVSVEGAAAGGPDTGGREWKQEEPEEWCLRLIRMVAKTGSASSEVQFALGRVNPRSRRPMILPKPEISVDGVRWRRVGSFSGAGPTDKVYVIRQDPDRSGSSRIEFGDGKNGAKPATRARVTASYRTGAGGLGNEPITRANRAEKSSQTRWRAVGGSRP